MVVSSKKTEQSEQDNHGTQEDFVPSSFFLLPSSFFLLPFAFFRLPFIG